MILSSLTLHNFRGYDDITIQFDHDFSVIIGRNDVGKSTILEALQIFFNSDQIKLEQNDLYVRHSDGDETIKISCEFQLNTDEIIVDSSVKTNLKQEFLYNTAGKLEICLISDGGKKPKFYIHANYPTAFATPLIQMKIADLRRQLDTFPEIAANENINRSIASDIRRAIYSSLGENPIRSQILIDLSKDDLKNLYQAIKKELPSFFLFRADRENRDDDVEIQSPLKIATKKALSLIDDELQEIKRKVERELTEIGNETIEKAKELDEEIAAGLQPVISLKPWESLFSFQLVDNDGISLNKRGSGIRRLLLLSYLRADAERQLRSKHNPKVIYAIEEPETAQHPDYQIKLIQSLLQLSQEPECQIIITTHTPEIAKMVQMEQIIFIQKTNRIPKLVCGDQKFSEIKKNLGVYTSNGRKVVVFVEGETDVQFLMNMNRLVEFSSIVDLSSEEVAIIPLQGGTLKQWIERDYLKSTNIKEIHIYDSDVASYGETVKKMNAANDGRRLGFITKHLEIENYIPRCLVEEEFSIDLSQYDSSWGTSLDIPKLLTPKVGKNLGATTKEQEKRIKMILNGRVMQKCTFAMVQEMGNVEEIASWFKAIKVAINQPV